VQVVGKDADIAKVASVLGNSVNDLNRTDFVPMFVGIGLGVLIGFYPLSIASLPMPVRLGLAGGPLVVAIVLTRIGRIGGLLWYMPPNANLALRELVITLFLAGAGLKAGEHFFGVLFSSLGLRWIASGAIVTLIPLLLGMWMVFFDGKSKLGWVLTTLGALVILLGIITNLNIYFRPTSLYNTLIILGLLAGGIGLIARSVRTKA
jgi:AspT/YidE/YbjL antiporter-like protein